MKDRFGVLYQFLEAADTILIISHQSNVTAFVSGSGTIKQCLEATGRLDMQNANTIAALTVGSISLKILPILFMYRTVAGICLSGTVASLTLDKMLNNFHCYRLSTSLIVKVSEYCSRLPAKNFTRIMHTDPIIHGISRSRVNFCTISISDQCRVLKCLVLPMSINYLPCLIVDGMRRSRMFTMRLINICSMNTISLASAEGLRSPH